jgi:hypothetical protein
MKLFNNLNLLWAFGYFGLFYLLIKYLGESISLYGCFLLVLLVGGGVWQLILWIAKIIGGKIDLEEEKLLKIIDDVLDDIGKVKTSKMDISILKQELYERVQTKQIKSINDIDKSIGELTK